MPQSVFKSATELCFYYLVTQATATSLPTSIRWLQQGVCTRGELRSESQSHFYTLYKTQAKILLQKLTNKDRWPEGEITILIPLHLSVTYRNRKRICHYGRAAPRLHTRLPSLWSPCAGTSPSLTGQGCEGWNQRDPTVNIHHLDSVARSLQLCLRNMVDTLGNTSCVALPGVIRSRVGNGSDAGAHIIDGEGKQEVGLHLTRLESGILREKSHHLGRGHLWSSYVLTHFDLETL